MGKQILIIASLIVFLAITSCSRKIIFTPALRAQLEKQNIDLKDVQFYNSEKIVLKRVEEQPEEVMVNEGAVEVTKGKIIEEIVIKKKTPAICKQVNRYHLNISFEANQDKHLKFGRKAGPMLRDRYRLYAKEWNEENGQVSYGDTIYNTGINAAEAHLLVEKSQIYDLIREKRVAKGIRIENGRD